jgi:hypothetical protein
MQQQGLYLKLKGNGNYIHNPFSYSPCDFPLDIHLWKTREHMKKEFQESENNLWLSYPFSPIQREMAPGRTAKPLGG